jgi:hypothetical protein
VTLLDLQMLLALVRRTAALLRSLVAEVGPKAQRRPGIADPLLRQLRGDEPAGASSV